MVSRPFPLDPTSGFHHRGGFGSAKSDQKQKMEFWGGKEQVMSEGSLVITPPPGIEAEILIN